MALIRTAVLMAILVAVSSANAGEIVDRIVAVVNGDIITLFELNENLKPVLRQFKGRQLTDEDKAVIAKIRTDLLEQMVQDKLIDQAVQKFGVTVSLTEVDNELETVITRSKLSKEAFTEQLKLEGMSLEDMKDRIREDILKHRLLGFMVKRKVVVSDEEVQEFYDSHASRYVLDKRVDLAVILAPTLPMATELRERIAKGEISFDEAAGLYSQGPAANQGGGLGELPWADIAPAWRDALGATGEGEMSEAFVFRGFGALLRINKVLGGEQRPFEDVAKEIKDMLYQKQLEQRFNEYMEELRANAIVEVKL